LEQADYGLGDRLLHHLVFGVPLVSSVSFEIDGLLPTKEPSDPNEKHVFVSGLARAGTTILMRAFYDTRQFRSLTYRDMPFVLMPGIWKKLSRPFHVHQEAHERVHGDGIYVDFDSPEAFEEVFWQTFSGDEYIFCNCLKPYVVSKELIEKFRLYLRRVVASSNDPNQRRYLSKNNNNILRLAAIRKAFPKSLIIIPFRDPLQHAISLLNQHQKSLSRHSIDQFSCDYMRWLGHHEFGATHKPFVFEVDGFSLAYYEENNINYWLQIWVSTYSYLLKRAPSDSIFVCFEDLCKSPVDILGYLFESADLQLGEDGLNEMFIAPRARDAVGVEKNLRDQAQRIFFDLRALTLTRSKVSSSLSR